MIGILLLSHGRLAEGLLDSCKLFFGEMEKVQALCLEEREVVESFDQRIIHALRQLDDGSGVMVCCDLYGGSPANRCALLLKEGYAMRVLTGMNLAMVIELMGMRPRFERADQIPAAELMEAGRNSIVLLNEAMENMDEEESFLF